MSSAEWSGTGRQSSRSLRSDDRGSPRSMSLNYPGKSLEPKQRPSTSLAVSSVKAVGSVDVGRFSASFEVVAIGRSAIIPLAIVPEGIRVRSTARQSISREGVGMSDQAGALQANTRSFATILTWALLALSLAFLTSLVLLRHGNLAWDDADYLRRGLADARQATAGTRLSDRTAVARPIDPRAAKTAAPGRLDRARSAGRRPIMVWTS